MTSRLRGRSLPSPPVTSAQPVSPGPSPSSPDCCFVVSGTVYGVLRSRWSRILLALIALVTVVPDVFSVVAGRYCDDWSTRPVAHPPLPGELFAASAESVREVKVSWLPAGFSGLAFPGAVLFDGEPAASVWLHEMTHQAQMRREGLLRYAFFYASDWVVGRYNGCGPLEAYESVRFEKEANLVARYRSVSIRGNFDPDDTSEALSVMRSMDMVGLGGLPFYAHLAELVETYRYAPSPLERDPSDSE